MSSSSVGKEQEKGRAVGKDWKDWDDYKIGNWSFYSTQSCKESVCLRIRNCGKCKNAARMV